MDPEVEPGFAEVNDHHTIPGMRSCNAFNDPSVVDKSYPLQKLNLAGQRGIELPHQFPFDHWRMGFLQIQTGKDQPTIVSIGLHSHKFNIHVIRSRAP
ncbi:hypothetical protein ACFL17_01160 [Pseudomonadota bacterium]